MKKMLFLTIYLIFYFVLPVLANESLEVLLKNYYNGKMNGASLEIIVMSSYSGEIEAQNFLAFNYLNRGDFKKAFEFFEKAALQGDDNSQRNLAYAYYEGEIVPKDNIMAYAYFNIVMPFYKKNEAKRIQNFDNFKRIIKFFGKENVQHIFDPDYLLALYQERDEHSQNIVTKNAKVYAYSNFNVSVYKKLKIKHVRKLVTPLMLKLSIEFKDIDFTDDSQGDFYLIDAHTTSDKKGFHSKLTLILFEVDDEFIRKIVPTQIQDFSPFSDASIIYRIEETLKKIIQEMTPSQIEKAQEVTRELLKKIDENKKKLEDVKKD